MYFALVLMWLHFYTNSKKTKNTQRGFSILEVLVTLFIVGMITAVLVSKYGSFNSVIVLKNQAFEIASNLREAQAYALSNKVEGGVLREDFGLYFDITAPQEYILFRDSGDLTEYSKNAAYYDVGEEVSQPYILDSRFEISRICVNIVSSSDTCPTTVDDLSVSFKRPNFDAQFSSVSGKSASVGLIDNVRIEVSSINDATFVKTVIVSSTGEISVE